MRKKVPIRHWNTHTRIISECVLDNIQSLTDFDVTPCPLYFTHIPVAHRRLYRADLRKIQHVSLCNDRASYITARDLPMSLTPESRCRPDDDVAAYPATMPRGTRSCFGCNCVVVCRVGGPSDPLQCCDRCHYGKLGRTVDDEDYDTISVCILSISLFPSPSLPPCPVAQYDSHE